MLDFSKELLIFRTELETTQNELIALETRLKQLPNTESLKEQLLCLKNPKRRVVIAPKTTEVKKTYGEKQTRRKKTEMVAFRSQIRAAIEVIGRRGKVFGAKNVLNTLKTQGHSGDASDAQIVRSYLKKLTEDGVLSSPSRGKFQFAS